MLLIYPPAARSSEAPLGIARLAAFIEGRGGSASCIDLCREGTEYLLGLELELSGADTWTRRAVKGRASAATGLRDYATYADSSRYRRAVADLGRALRAVSLPRGAEVSLADYRDPQRSPLRIADLADSAARFEENLFYPLFESRIAPALAEAKDGWVGVSICFLSQALCAFALLGFIKAKRPDLRLAVGGGLVTSYSRVSGLDLSSLFPALIDLAMIGPGEDSLAELYPLSSGANLGAEDCGPSSLDLELGDFALDSYFAPTRILPYNFSWGCPWKNCAFCPEKAEDMPYRGIPAPEALRRLSALAERYTTGLIHFTDNEVSPLYLAALASSPKIAPWYGFARFSRRLLEPGFCESLAASGCVMLQLGLESGDQAVLDAMGKGTKVGEIERILANLDAVGIGTFIYVLFGTPSEDRDAALRTRDFVARHASSIDFINVAVFNLPASGAEAKRLATQSFYEGELSLYREFRHPAGWDRGPVRRFLAEDFESDPAIKTILARNPPVFTSNHAPFFLMA
jgi:Fe-S oxidoreductase